MCGIAGYFGMYDRALLSEMAARIAHRGPDGEGLWADEPARVGMAHRRLAIIDPTAAANQPMESCEGRYQVVFNGEIYNFRELAADLSARGYAFNQNSDTAILGPLYDATGPAMLSRLNGIFAFALWDRQKQELFIARDAYGVKPLYYARIAGVTLFGSELKALLAHPDVDRKIDVDAISDYLIHLWSPGQRTPLRGVSKLLPGHYLRLKDGLFEDVAWRDAAPARSSPHPGKDAHAIASQVAELFDKAVSDQCMSDVPVGAFLSGGVDSSAVVASMVKSGNKPLRTYCIGFEGDSMADEGFGDDLTYARIMAKRLDVALTPILVKEPSGDAIENLVHTLDEPEADPAPLYVEAISQQARLDGIKVLLGGTGGDDIFSGYRRHKAAALRARAGFAVRMFGSLPIETISGVLPAAARRRVEKLHYMFQGSDSEFLLRSFEFNPRKPALDVLTPAARAGLSAESAFAQAIREESRGALVDRMLMLEMRGFLPDHNLNYTDKASMAHGVEVRVPFLDQHLVEFASAIPWQMKTTLRDEKWIFKQSQVDRLPPEILCRQKTGFGAPVRRWIAGPMSDMFSDIIETESFRHRGLFDVEKVRTLLRDTVSGRKDNAYLVLAIVMVELWMRIFIDRQPRGPVSRPEPALGRQ